MRERVAGTADRSRSHATLHRVLLGLTLLAPIMLLVAGDVALVPAVALTLALAVQTATGAVWWTLVRRTGTSTIELAAAGSTFGVVGALVAAQVLRGGPLDRVAWLAPTLLTIVILAASRGARTSARTAVASRRRLRSLDLVGLAVGIAVGVPLLTRFWDEAPLRFAGVHRYNQDVVFHESLAQSLRELGPSRHILASGEAIHYHWFAHAWSGAMSAFVETEPFVVTTRVVPVTALVTAVLAAWAWSEAMAPRARWAAPLAAALVAAGGYVGADHPRAGLQLVPESPSQALTTAWLLTTCLCVTLFLRRAIARGPGLAALAGLGIALVGGKVSHAAVFAGGMIALAGASLVTRKLDRAAIWLASVATGAGVVVGYLVLISGNDGSGLTFGFTRTAAEAYRVEPWPGTGTGIAIGAGLLTLAIVARLVGFAWLFSRSAGDLVHERIMGAGVITFGLLGTLLTTQSGASQLWFGLSASAIVAVLSANGLDRAWSAARRTWTGMSTPRERVLLGGLVGLVTVVVAWAIGELSGVRIGSLRHLQPWSPLVAWLLVLAVAGTIVPFALRARRGARVRATSVVGTAMLMALALVTPAVAHRSPRPSVAEPSIGWTEAHVESLRWLGDHTDRDDVVLSNRICTIATHRPPECNMRWFLVSAVSGSQMFLEGVDYVAEVGARPQWMLDRLALIERFTADPDPASHREAWDAGVRWVWLDRQVPSETDWTGIGRIARDDDAAVIVRLDPPP